MQEEGEGLSNEGSPGPFLRYRKLLYVKEDIVRGRSLKLQSSNSIEVEVGRGRILMAEPRPYLSSIGNS